MLSSFSLKLNTKGRRHNLKTGTFGGHVPNKFLSDPILKKKNTAKLNMSSAVCASSMYVQSSLHENVVCSVRARMGNATYIIFIMWSTISGLDTWYRFRLNVGCGVAVNVRSQQEKFQVILLREGEGGRKHFGGESQFSRLSSIFRSSPSLAYAQFRTFFAQNRTFFAQNRPFLSKIGLRLGKVR